MRYLPAEATDIRLISDRNGHMAHYRISAEAFDTFLARVWERYRKERAAEPKSVGRLQRGKYHRSAQRLSGGPLRAEGSLNGNHL